MAARESRRSRMALREAVSGDLIHRPFGEVPLLGGGHGGYEDEQDDGHRAGAADVVARAESRRIDLGRHDVRRAARVAGIAARQAVDQIEGRTGPAPSSLAASITEAGMP